MAKKTTTVTREVKPGGRTPAGTKKTVTRTAKKTTSGRVTDAQVSRTRPRY